MSIKNLDDETLDKLLKDLYKALEDLNTALENATC